MFFNNPVAIQERKYHNTTIIKTFKDTTEPIKIKAEYTSNLVKMERLLSTLFTVKNINKNHIN